MLKEAFFGGKLRLFMSKIKIIKFGFYFLELKKKLIFFQSCHISMFGFEGALRILEG